MKYSNQTELSYVQWPAVRFDRLGENLLNLYLVRKWIFNKIYNPSIRK